MSAITALHEAALDAAVWASASPAVIAETMADELAKLLAAEGFTPFQHEELTGLLRGLRMLADRMEVGS